MILPVCMDHFMCPKLLFFKYIYTLEQNFFSLFSDLCINSNIGATYFDILKTIEFNPPFQMFPKTYVLKLFIRLRIFYALKFVNREFRKQKLGNKKNRKIVILSQF